MSQAVAREPGDTASGAPQNGFASAAALANCRDVYLAGCEIPTAWRGRPQWRVLDTAFDTGLNFLTTWQAWREDADRPRLLHYVSILTEPAPAQDILRCAAASAELPALARELATQWRGLVGGMHRLRFEEGRVMLTLCIGNTAAMLRELAFRADSIFLMGAAAQARDRSAGDQMVRRLSRLCHRGTRIATCAATIQMQHALRQCGFVLNEVHQPASQHHGLRGVYDPAWKVKGADLSPALQSPGRCAVVGAGLAGAAVADAFALRGWQVEVFDAQARPAQGASGLPAGLMAPHQSPDDNLISRLSRAGVRTGLHHARRLLREGDDWQESGVLERRLDDTRPPPDLGAAGLDWTRPSGGANDWLHPMAAWVRPAALAGAWLAHPAIRFRPHARIDALRRDKDGWLLLANSQEVGQADVVVVAAALGSAALVELPLHPVRGQVSWGFCDQGRMAAATPINGNGHFIPSARIQGRAAWVAGSTYGRGDAGLDVRSEDHAANLERLLTLDPASAGQLAPLFATQGVQAWCGIRCASRDRRPLVGWLEPGLGVSTAMGSRGLSFAALCAELLAAQLHGEPLPMEMRLAQALDLRRHAGGVKPPA